MNKNNQSPTQAAVDSQEFLANLVTAVDTALAVCREHWTNGAAVEAIRDAQECVDRLKLCVRDIYPDDDPSQQGRSDA